MERREPEKNVLHAVPNFVEKDEYPGGNIKHIYIYAGTWLRWPGIVGRDAVFTEYIAIARHLLIWPAAIW